MMDEQQTQVGKILGMKKKTFLNYRIMMGIDVIIAIVSLVVAYALIDEMHPISYATRSPWELFWGGILLLAVTLTTSYYSSLSRQSFRYAELSIRFRSLFFLAVNAFIVPGGFLAIQILYGQEGYSLAIGVLLGLLYGMVLVSLTIVQRTLFTILARMVYRKEVVPGGKPTIVVGTGEWAMTEASRLDAHPKYKVVGYLSWDKAMASYHIKSKPILVFHNEANFFRLVRKYGIQSVVFPSRKDYQNDTHGLLAICAKLGIETLMHPTPEEGAGSNQREGLRPIVFEDLLERDPIKLDIAPVKRMYEGKVVLVTGAAGSIGSEIVRQLARLDVRQLILFDNAETPVYTIEQYLKKHHPALSFVPVVGDVRLRDRVEKIFEMYNPQIVLHAAAYKHVPLMESNPCEAVHVNVIGTSHIADCCLKYGVEKMIMVSTDKAVNPTNVMGATKRAAEMYVQSLGRAVQLETIEGKTCFVTTRFGNVLGSQGSVLHLFRDQIASGGPVTVTHRQMTRYFMSIPEACSLVLQASVLGQEANIYAFDMGEPHTIWGLAERLIRMMGYEPHKDIQIVEGRLRPGEKLYEEVLSADEAVASTTAIEKIFVARAREVDYQMAKEGVHELYKLVLKVDRVGCVRVLKELIPEYVSQNSEFEKLDQLPPAS